MEWMKLTAPDFAKAVKDSEGVCVVPLGSIEKHGDHLPLGTDTYNTEARVRQACEKVNAVMFPVIPFMENSESTAHPGSVAMRSSVLFQFLWNIFDEIARNGFRKILIVNGHGGNYFVTNHLTQDFLTRLPDYMIYLSTVSYSPELSAELLESEEQGHGGERETSIALHNVPELVKMEDVVGERVPKLGRLAHLKDVKTPIWWYAAVPQHYTGDARTASAGKGKRFHDDLAERIAENIRAIREDETTLEIYEEYRRRTRAGGLTD